MEKATSKELHALTFEQLLVRAEEARRELFQLRLRAASTHVKAFPSEQKRLKREIARALTIGREKFSAII